MILVQYRISDVFSAPQTNFHSSPGYSREQKLKAILENSFFQRVSKEDAEVTDQQKEGVTHQTFPKDFRTESFKVWGLSHTSYDRG